MAKTICELAPWEAELWREKGVKPNCRDHRHISKSEACEKTCHGDYRPHATPLARWAGPHHVVLVADRLWRPVPSDYVAVLQLVPGTALECAKLVPPTVAYQPHGLPSIRSRADGKHRRSLTFSIPTSS